MPRPDLSVGEAADLLPGDTPVHRAWKSLTDHFGSKSVLSEIVVVFERANGPLSADDLQSIEGVAAALAKPLPNDPAAKELSQISIRTPGALTFAGDDNPLVSHDHHAALIQVALPFNFITKQAARVSEHAQHVVKDATLPPGLSAAVTGSAGYGYDYAVATIRSHEKTVVVTLIAVVLILLIIYRAPLAAMLPLAGVGLAAVIAMTLVTAGEKIGLHSGTAERIFTFVLLFGAGIDYSLLLISRYREFLKAELAPADAIIKAVDASLMAIVASTTMTASGLVMLCFARFSVFHDAGPAVVLAVVIAAAASLTLVPAMIALIGPAIFWPGRNLPKPTDDAVAARGFWPAIARLVISRPKTVVLVTTALLLLPALRGGRISWNYDALHSIKETYPARIGSAMAQRHWPIGETGPVTLICVVDQPLTQTQWSVLSEKIVPAVTQISQVAEVRALSCPLGLHVSPGRNFAIRLLGGKQISAEMLSPDLRAMRISVILTEPALTREAMNDVTRISASAADALRAAGISGHIQIAGATAEMMDIRAVTQTDFYHIAGLSIAAILIMLISVLRDPAVAIFILAATALSYLTTLGLTYWILHALGANGLEWKVQMLLFIVLVAVGQDYSIFFAMRFAQEAKTLPCAAAVERAVIFTGPVISSCGLIMAATLGSLMVGDISLLLQLGFAFALGMMIDTFIVRPLLLPGFIVLTNRTLRRAMTLGAGH